MKRSIFTYMYILGRGNTPTSSQWSMAVAEVCAACCRTQCPQQLKEDPSNAAKLGWNVCYVTAGLVVREDKVILVQEAKRSCRGRWYLPAGRVDKGETIEEGVRRETVEESGVDIETLALMAVEFQSSQWIRFSFTGRPVGGKLKTPAEEDKESIQAQWLPVDTSKLHQEVHLRASDCVQLIRLAGEWFGLPEASRCSGGFIGSPHTSSTIRVLVAHSEGDSIAVLVSTAAVRGSFLPTLSLHGVLFVSDSIVQRVKAAGCQDSCSIKGVMSVEHSGRSPGGGDGVMLTVLVSVTNPSLSPNSAYHWEKVEQQAALSSLRNALTATFGCAKLIDL